MTAGELQDLLVNALVRKAGGSKRDWRAAMGKVRVYSPETHPHCNWSVAPSGSNGENAIISGGLECRADDELITAGRLQTGDLPQDLRCPHASRPDLQVSLDHLACASHHASCSNLRDRCVDEHPYAKRLQRLAGGLGQVRGQSRQDTGSRLDERHAQAALIKDLQPVVF